MEVARAVGVLPREPHLRRALQIDADETFFAAAPQGLRCAPPKSQDFAGFARESPFREGCPGSVLVAPMGLPDDARTQSLLRSLRAYLPALVVERHDCAPQLRLFRRSAGGALFAHDLLDVLSRSRPASCSVLLGLTAEPLCAAGEPASCVQGEDGCTAMLSLHRRGGDWQDLLTLVHNMHRLLGLAECGFLACLMNPVDSGAPLHLCPVCLRKLSVVLSPSPASGLGGGGGQRQAFDAVRYYKNLAQRFRDLGAAAEQRWCEARVMAITHEAWRVPDPSEPEPEPEPEIVGPGPAPICRRKA